MYLITNEGLRILEESGLKKICAASFDGLEHYLLHKCVFEEDIEEYAKEHGILDLLEKINMDESFDRDESFILHSELICDLLKDKLPKKINKELKNTISAYWIYYNRFLKPFSKSYLWRDDNFLNMIESDIHGDMKIKQYDITTSPNLFGDKQLVKKTDLNLVDGFYPEWIRTLSDFITFCLQIRRPVPFKDNWEEIFYNGIFLETKPGMVAKSYIEDFVYAKEGGEHGIIGVLPFVDNPLKHINPEKGILNIGVLKSDGGYLCQPFIDGENLVYFHKTEKGIEFIGETWGNLE